VPAIAFEIEVESLIARLFNAKGGISKPGTPPETVAQVRAAIEFAMQFKVGGDLGAVAAKQRLRELEREAQESAEKQFDWPHDDRYLNRCPHCKTQFAGPKRAPSCWSCASDAGKAWWRSKFPQEAPDTATQRGAP
jgi:hypothetical protein